MPAPTSSLLAHILGTLAANWLPSRDLMGADSIMVGEDKDEMR